MSSVYDSSSSSVHYSVCSVCTAVARQCSKREKLPAATRTSSSTYSSEDSSRKSSKAYLYPAFSFRRIIIIFFDGGPRPRYLYLSDQLGINEGIIHVRVGKKPSRAVSIFTKDERRAFSPLRHSGVELSAAFYRRISHSSDRICMRGTRKSRARRKTLKIR